MFGTVGLIYNKDVVKEKVDSWDILWDEKYKDQIFMFDTYRDTIGVALKKLGYSLNSTNKDEINTYLEDLKKQGINIDKKLNKDILIRISILELKCKINYLLAGNLPILDNNGYLIDIFSMTNIDIKEKYNISLDEIIATYNKSKTL